MNKSTNEIKLYNDILILEAFQDDRFIKQAGAMGSLLNAAKDYFASKIDPNDKAGSILKLIAPGAISVALSAIGLPWVVVLVFGLAVNVFHIDIPKVLGSIYTSISSMISGNKKVSSAEVDNVVSSAIDAHAPAAPVTASLTINDVRIINLALIQN
jgi:hypothetical protein